MGHISIDMDFLEDYMKKNSIKSHRQLAINIGISTTTLYRILDGSRNPGSKTINKMLEYFVEESFETLFYKVKDC